MVVYLNSLHGDFVYDDMKAVVRRLLHILFLLLTAPQVENADVDASKTKWQDLFYNNFWGACRGLLAAGVHAAQASR